MENILQDLHEGVMGGHLGKDKTFECVKELFYWPIKMLVSGWEHVELCGKEVIYSTKQSASTRV